MNQIVLAVVLPLLAAFLLRIIMRAAPVLALMIGPLVLMHGIWLTTSLWLMTEGNVYSVAIGGFAPPLGINLHVDGVSLLLVLATQIMGLLFWPFSLDDETPRRQALMLLLIAAASGLALSGDLFNLYVFYELLAIASFGLVAVAATGAAYAATFRYLILNGIGSVLILLGIALIYGQTGTLNLAHLAQLAPEQLDNAPGLAAFTAILIGVGVKAELFPVNTWVAEIYAVASSRVSAMLAGLISKLAVLVIVRLLVLIFHQPQASQIMLVLGMLGVISGELAAWRAKDMNRMLAFSSIAQLGVIFIAFSVPAGAGLFAGLALVFHHLLIKPGLFILAERWGGALGNLRGAGFVSPLAAGLFVLFAFSLVGMPPLPGFWAKFLLGTALAAQAEPLYTVALIVILTATVIEASYLFRVASVMFKRSGDSQVTAHSGLNLTTATLIGGVLIVATVFIAPLGRHLQVVSLQAGDVAGYVNRVSLANPLANSLTNPESKQ